MNTSLYLAATIVPFGLLLLWQWALFHRAKQRKGRPAPDTSAVDGQDQAARRVYYFHSAHCGRCRALTLIVDQLHERHPNLSKIDVTEHVELARRFGIAATPTFVTVDNGLIQEVKLGAPSERWLRSQLTGSDAAAPDPGDPSQDQS